MKCADTKGAQAYCPVRWKALQKWINSTKQVSDSFILASSLGGGGMGVGAGVRGGRKRQFNALKSETIKRNCICFNN